MRVVKRVRSTLAVGLFLAAVTPLGEAVAQVSEPINDLSAFDEVRNPDWRPGISVGSLGDGGARFVIHGTVPAYPDCSNPEGGAVDAAGNVYGAVVSGGGACLRSVRR